MMCKQILKNIVQVVFNIVNLCFVEIISVEILSLESLCTFLA